MNTKHTPGPWYIDHEYNIFAENAGKTSKHGIALTRRLGPSTLLEEVKANARLIAAAPEMLEALKNLIDCYSECFGKPDIERAKDAINKAEGRN